MLSDFYTDRRQEMVSAMQISLRQVRQVLGFGVQEFADLVGWTRQTVNNLETGKTKMSSAQYLVICAVIDNCFKDRPELCVVISNILCSNVPGGHSALFHTIESGSLLRNWFLSFPDDTRIVDIPGADRSLSEYTALCKIAECYRIFLDNTVVEKEGFADAVQPLIRAMEEHGNQFIVPIKVVEVLQHQLIDIDHRQAERAKTAMKLIVEMQGNGGLQIRGETSDVNVYSTFVSVFARFKCVHRLALISCDPQLFRQIQALNDSSLGGFPILLMTFDGDTGLRRWTEDDLTTVLPERIPSVENREMDSSLDSELDLKGWGSID